MFNGTNITLSSDVDKDAYGKVTKYNTQESQEVRPFPAGDNKAARNIQDSINKDKYET